MYHAQLCTNPDHSGLNHYLQDTGRALRDLVAIVDALPRNVARTRKLPDALIARLQVPRIGWPSNRFMASMPTRGWLQLPPGGAKTLMRGANEQNLLDGQESNMIRVFSFPLRSNLDDEGFILNNCCHSIQKGVALRRLVCVGRRRAESARILNLIGQTRHASPAFLQVERR